MFSTAARTIASLLLIGGSTALNLNVFHVNSATAAFTYLLIVLALATAWGFIPSIAAAVGGMLCYNYFFIPPVGTFTIGDPENWVALVVFLITAVTASHLSSSAQQRAREALARQLELERLYQFSRSLMLLHTGQPLGGQIAGQVLRIFDLREVAFFEARTGQFRWAGVEPALLSHELLRGVLHRSETKRTPEGQCRVSPVTLGGQQVGAIGVCGSISEAALQAVASLSGIVLERGRTQEAAARAEAARENQQLKSTLLDALAHEFKTPLTSIKAAVTSVIAHYSHPPAEHDLLSVVDEEADRMNAMVTDSIELARLEAGHLHLHAQPCNVQSLITQSVSQLTSFLDGRVVDVAVPHGLPIAYADRHLIELVIRQLVQNAVKYSSPESPIRIAASQQGDFIEVQVANEGAAIPEHEQEAIFDKFYRGEATREQIPGTGLGLTIAREIIEAHHGSIGVKSRVNEGACFAFTLPSQPYPPSDSQ